MSLCHRRWSVSLFAAALCVIGGRERLSAQLSSRSARVDVVAPVSPVPVAAGGQTVVAYELHITNFGQGALGLRELDVFAARGGAPMASYRDSALDQLLQPVGEGMPGMMGMGAGDPRRVEPGRRTVVYLWLSFARDSGAPAALRHRLVFDLLDTADVRRDGGTQEAVDSITVSVSRDSTPLIRAPLDGGEWVLGGSSNTSAHRRALNAVNGRATIGQRFAIDFQKIGPNGNTFHDDEHKNEDYWGFGEPVHAVAAGEVVVAVDTVLDHDAHGPLPPLTQANLPGNHVIVRIGPGRYASYAHLKHGSVRVRVGQRVTRGQVLAQVGMTGQTTGPHLHFQISDRPSVLVSEGVPFRLESFRFLGLAQDFEESHHVSVPRRREMPLDNYVIGLP